MYMKNFFINIVLFFLFTLLVYPVFIILSGYLPILKNIKRPNLNYRLGSYGHMYSRINELKKLDNNVDILFLGSSHAYRGFDPRNFKEYKVFNLGSSAQTPIQTKVLLNRYLHKINPKTVVFEVNPGILERDGVESSLDIIANDKNDFLSIKMAFELNDIKTYNTLIYALFQDVLHPDKDFSEPIKKDDDTYIPGGFVEREINYYKFIDYNKSEWKFNKNQLKSFNECIYLLKSKNIRIILVFAPITSRLYSSYVNNYYVDSFIMSYNLEYYNFNKLIKLNDSLHFYDSHHLNQYGVDIFNRKLIDIINFN